MDVLASALLLIAVGVAIGVPLFLMARRVMRQCRIEAEEEREEQEIRLQALRELENEGIGVGEELKNVHERQGPH